MSADGTAMANVPFRTREIRRQVLAGLALTLVLLGTLLYVLWHDRADKLAAAERRVAAIASPFMGIVWNSWAPSKMLFLCLACCAK